MLRIFVFFSFVCAWCAEPIKSDESSVRVVKRGTFSVPGCWKREVCLPAPLECQILVADLMPKGLTDLTVLYAQGDYVAVANERYYANCKVFLTDSSGGDDSLLELSCAASGRTYRGFVMMCPVSEGSGGMILMNPMAKVGKIVNFNKCNSLNVDGELGPIHFCDYAVDDHSFTIDRFVQRYEDESYYFVGVTFNYSQLNRVLVEWGVKKGASRNVIDSDLFEFPSSKGGPPIVYKT